MPGQYGFFLFSLAHTAAAIHPHTLLCSTPRHPASNSGTTSFPTMRSMRRSNKLEQTESCTKSAQFRISRVKSAILYFGAAMLSGSSANCNNRSCRPSKALDASSSPTKVGCLRSNPSTHPSSCTNDPIISAAFLRHLALSMVDPVAINRPRRASSRCSNTARTIATSRLDLSTNKAHGTALAALLDAPSSPSAGISLGSIYSNHNALKNSLKCSATLIKLGTATSLAAGEE
mmetsp:Transcript_13608/g.20210  ORF Transcript_13608/g.20210 Transcript_13608/m.20210 type:complete len:232 (-) Transcript_13608:1296-1991(-)